MTKKGERYYRERKDTSMKRVKVSGFMLTKCVKIPEKLVTKVTVSVTKCLNRVLCTEKTINMQQVKSQKY